MIVHGAARGNLFLSGTGRSDSVSASTGNRAGDRACAVAQALVHWLVHRNRVFRCAPASTAAAAAAARTRGRLRVVHINVWSGVRYTGELDWRTWFTWEAAYETRRHAEQRYAALVRGVANLDADVVTINEAMPSRRCAPWALITCLAATAWRRDGAAVQWLGSVAGRRAWVGAWVRLLRLLLRLLLHLRLLLPARPSIPHAPPL